MLPLHLQFHTTKLVKCTSLFIQLSNSNSKAALVHHIAKLYWSHAISSTGNDTKALWQKLKCLLSQPSTVHSHFSADQFLQHFSGKISHIREATASLNPPDIHERNVDIPLSEFRLATVAEVTAIIKKSPAKQDPMPTWLLKDLSDVIALIITAMCNASISQGKFPAAHKSAIVRPRQRNPVLTLRT